jgi:hypothetical protein
MARYPTGQPVKRTAAAVGVLALVLATMPVVPAFDTDGALTLSSGTAHAKGKATKGNKAGKGSKGSKGKGGGSGRVPDNGGASTDGSYVQPPGLGKRQGDAPQGLAKRGADNPPPGLAKDHIIPPGLDNLPELPPGLRGN